MILNVLAVDPLDPERVLQYRVPENSRELELLIRLLTDASIDHTTLAARDRTYKRKQRK